MKKRIMLIILLATVGTVISVPVNASAVLEAESEFVTEETDVTEGIDVTEGTDVTEETDETDETVVNDETEDSTDLELVNQSRKEIKSIIKGGTKNLNKANRKLKKAQKYTSGLTQKTASEAKKSSKKAKALLKQASSLLKKVKKSLSSAEKKISQPFLLKSQMDNPSSLSENMIKELNNSYKNSKKQYNKISKKRKNFDTLSKRLKKKLKEFNISSETNLSEVMGFSKTELQYLFSNIPEVIKNENVRKILANNLPKYSKKYKVNELGVLAIMAVETGRFTSSLCTNYYNFGGLRDYEGNYLHYSTISSGIEAMVKYVRDNMNNGPSILEINTTYCPGNFSWTEHVVFFLKEIKAVQL